MQKIILLIFVITAFSVSAVSAKDSTPLNDVKRPEFHFRLSETAPEHSSDQIDQKINNSKFSGFFAGTVTVHYKEEMVTTTANLTINTDIKNISKSHYNYYIIPPQESYMEYDWELDGVKIKRTVTISGNTLYITDIINYEKNGGNSQIRTLVFNPDFSALTFLKTEFDDGSTMQATGHIIGRFKRIK